MNNASMMKKIFLLTFIQLIGIQMFSQNIKSVQAYSKFSTTRIIVLTEDNQTAYYTTDAGWRALPVKELPEGEIKFLDVYHTVRGSSLMVVMADNSIWQIVNDEWSKLEVGGLPQDYSVEEFKPFSKVKMYGATELQVVMLLNDNTLWLYSEKDGWESLSKTGIPESSKILKLATYQKMKGMMSIVSTFLVSLEDRSMLFFDLKKKKWKEFKTEQLPKNTKVNSLHSYLKYSVMGVPKGRIIVSLSDQSIWWCAEEDQDWNKLDKSGLPENASVKSIKVFTKGLTARVLVLLDNNSIWWYAEGSGFSKVDMTGFSKSLED
jgi:hypothetical protein